MGCRGVFSCWMSWFLLFLFVVIALLLSVVDFMMQTCFEESIGDAMRRANRFLCVLVYSCSRLFPSSFMRVFSRTRGLFGLSCTLSHEEEESTGERKSDDSSSTWNMFRPLFSFRCPSYVRIVERTTSADSQRIFFFSRDSRHIALISYEILILLPTAPNNHFF